MTSKREWVGISLVCVKHSLDEPQIARIGHKIRRGYQRGVRCYRRGNGQYEAVDSLNAAWTEAYRRAGVDRVPIVIVTAGQPSQVQKAVDILRTRSFDPNMSESALAECVGVSRGTLRRALQIQPLVSGSATLHLWEKTLIDPQFPLKSESVDLIASFAPDLNPIIYTPSLTQLLTNDGHLWLIFEARHQDNLPAWKTAFQEAGLVLKQQVAWATTEMRYPLHSSHVAGYRLLLAFGKTHELSQEDEAEMFPAWCGPRVPGDGDPSSQIIPAWIWARWLAEIPFARIILDPFATSTTVFDAARTVRGLQEAWACPVDEVRRGLLRHYLDFAVDFSSI